MILTLSKIKSRAPQFLVPMFLCASACSGDFTKSYELNQFKVIALIADKPEINPGDTFTITPYISDITGNGRTITYSAQACVDPGIGFGAEPNCNNDENKVVLATDVPVSGLTAPYYTSAITPTITAVTPPVNDIFESIPAELQFNGVDFLVVVEFKSNGTVLDTALRRIKVSTKPVKNLNPVFQSPAIASAGTDLTELTAETKLAGLADAASFENFEDMRNGTITNQKDKLLVYWFASQGEFSFSSSESAEETTWKPNTKNNTLPFVLLAVLRDKRGGVSVVQKNF